MFLSTLFASFMLLAGGIQPTLIEQYTDHINSFLEQYLQVDVPPVKEAEKALSTMKDDGSWNINYKDTGRSRWVGSKHITNIRNMAITYYATGREDMLQGTRKALRWWYTIHPKCKNWWYNEIGGPKELCPPLILIKDKLSDEEVAGLVKVMDEAGFRMTGQNKIWLAGNVLMKAILLNDDALMIQARDSIVSELRITSEEGLQDDWSFHQHGPQLQWGNYGLSYAGTLSWWALAFRDTPLEIKGEQLEILTNYLVEGLQWPVWRGYFDMNASGRQISKGQQKSKARAVAAAFKRAGLEMNRPEGARYFPRSDFGIFRASDWYASVRMQSSRVKGFECTNSENMLGYFCSDGALLVRRRGDEYFNIASCWDWKHVPGTTTYDDGKPLWGYGDSKFPFNDTPRVFGMDDRDNDILVAAMELDRDGLSARKAYFICPEGIVCLGTGISMVDDSKVRTTINQCRLVSEVTKGRGWVNHDGITYVSLDGQKIDIFHGPRAGNWHPIAPYYPDKEESMDVFDAGIEHGKHPEAASYAYAICPDGSADGKSSAAAIKRSVSVVSNTRDIQSVRFGAHMLTIDWNNTKITID